METCFAGKINVKGRGLYGAGKIFRLASHFPQVIAGTLIGQRVAADAA